MAENLNLDADVTAIKAINSSATGWANRITTLLDKLATASKNPFGSAAVKDVGTTSGDLVALDSNAKIPIARLPYASVSQRGVVEKATVDEGKTGTDNTRYMTAEATAAAISDAPAIVPSATTGRPGVTRFATASQTGALSSTTLAVNPAGLSGGQRNSSMRS